MSIGSPGRCAPESVRSNIAHTESVAGPVGLLNAALAVRHGRVLAPVDRAARS
ncbi:hypothetical protein [Streptomyces sp. CSDS2]|uniref:hypothetical protein n=1 Tax=Streptomyces sp. CSDS2 TaxID=3055051 RepID=UPI00339D5324